MIVRFLVKRLPLSLITLWILSIIVFLGSSNSLCEGQARE